MTVYVHLYAIDAAGSLHTLGQKISSPRRADSEGAVGRGKRTGGKGGGDGGTAPRRAALDSDEAQMGSRAGDADGDRRVLGDAAWGDRGGGRASGSATAWAMRKEMSRLSSGTGVFFGFGRGCFTGGGVLVLMAASRHRQPSGGTGAHFPAWPRPQLLSRGPRLIWAFAAPFFGTLGFLAPHFMRHGSAAKDQ